MFRPTCHQCFLKTVILRVAIAALASGLSPLASAQQAPPVRPPDIDIKKTAPAAAPPPPVITQPAPAVAPKPKGGANTTVIERSGADPKTQANSPALKLVALLTADGQQIDQGMIWRVYSGPPDANGKSKLVVENREPSPALKLPPGEYTINAAFGRANLTRKITVKPGGGTEQFVLNAGGLRVNASVGGKPTLPNTTSYAIYSDDRDQFAKRAAVMTGAHPGLVIRLNSGIYHIVSTYGDANAKVEADVTVEAGKLTEASLSHTAAKAAFKLVTRTGGEALPDTHWTIQTPDGEIVKESVGALPTHVLAPGDYTVSAKAGGRVFKKSFILRDGDFVNIEVLMEGGEATREGDIPIPALDVKNP
jgi:hypothetical protein